MRTPIPPLDLLFYLLETHDSPKHVAGLQVFQLPPDAAPDYLLQLVEQLRARAPIAPFNRYPHFSATRLPEWREAEQVEMAYHLRHSALPKPGTMDQLLTVVQRLHAGVLDRQRPGWICQVIEGLEGNRFAIYSKVHHAYIDGMSGTRRMYGALSEDPSTRNITPMWAYEPAPEPRAGTAPQTARRGLSRQLRAVGDLNRQLLRVGMELLRLRQPSGRIPFQAPRTRINAPVASDLRSIGVTSLPLDRIKAVSNAAGCTINDVVLSVTDAALHDYLARHDDRPQKALVAMCPMSLRDASDPSANTQVATLLVELGQRDASPVERLQQVAASAAAAKAEAREMSREALMNYVLMLGASFEILGRTGLEKTVPQSYNVLVSNVPGPGTEALYLAGSRLLASYPISTLTPGNNLNVTVLSHGNSLDFGLLGALGSLPDIDYLVQRLEARFDELAAALGIGQSRAKPRKKTSRKPAAKRKQASASRTPAAKKSAAAGNKAASTRPRARRRAGESSSARPKHAAPGPGSRKSH